LSLDSDRRPCPGAGLRHSEGLARIRRARLFCPHARRGSGLTVAELLAAIAVLSVLAGLTTLRAARLMSSIHLPLDARRLAADLSLARATAVLRNTRATITFTHHAYTVRYDRGAPEKTRGVLHRDVGIVAIPRAGALSCYASGRCDNGTVVLASNAGERRSVVLNMRGRVRMGR